MNGNGGPPPRRRLGKTNLWVSPLSLGGVGLGHIYGPQTQEKAVATVLKAVERGGVLIVPFSYSINVSDI